MSTRIGPSPRIGGDGLAFRVRNHDRALSARSIVQDKSNCSHCPPPRPPRLRDVILKCPSITIARRSRGACRARHWRQSFRPPPRPPRLRDVILKYSSRLQSPGDRVAPAARRCGVPTRLRRVARRRAGPARPRIDYDQDLITIRTLLGSTKFATKATSNSEKSTPMSRS